MNKKEEIISFMLFGKGMGESSGSIIRETVLTFRITFEEAQKTWFEALKISENGGEQ